MRISSRACSRILAQNRSCEVRDSVDGTDDRETGRSGPVCAREVTTSSCARGHASIWIRAMILGLCSLERHGDPEAGLYTRAHGGSKTAPITRGIFSARNRRSGPQKSHCPPWIRSPGAAGSWRRSSHTGQGPPAGSVELLQLAPVIIARRI